MCYEDRLDSFDSNFSSRSWQCAMKGSVFKGESRILKRMVPWNDPSKERRVVIMQAILDMYETNLDHV